MRRFELLALAVLLTMAVGSDASVDRVPRLDLHDDVPHDLRALAEGTWARFLDAFPARTACIPDVALVASWELADRAEYRPEPPTVLVRIPATAGQLETALVHEFAHHLEFQCAAHGAIRTAFLGTQGIPDHHPWFAGGSWEATPSEQFAEATVEVVLGRRSLHRLLSISEEATALIEAWGRDGDPTAIVGPAAASQQLPESALSTPTRMEEA